MSLMNFIHGQGAAGTAVVVLPTIDFSNTGTSAPVYSGVKFDADGNIYARQAGGGYSQVAAWLLIGTASDYYINRTVISGSLTTDAGDDLVLSTDREYDKQVNAYTSMSVIVNFQIQNVGNDVLAERTYTFFAERNAETIQ